MSQTGARRSAGRRGHGYVKRSARKRRLPRYASSGHQCFTDCPCFRLNFSLSWLLSPHPPFCPAPLFLSSASSSHLFFHNSVRAAQNGDTA